MGPYLADALQRVLSDQSAVVEVRGAGLRPAEEFAPAGRGSDPIDPGDAVVALIVADMSQRGVIARPILQGGNIGFSPPLSLTKDEADIIIDAFHAAVMAPNFRSDPLRLMANTHRSGLRTLH